MLLRGLHGKGHSVDDVQRCLEKDLAALGFAEPEKGKSRIHHIELGETCKEQLAVQNRIRLTNLAIKEADARLSLEGEGTCRAWYFRTARRFGEWLQGKGLATPLRQRKEKLEAQSLEQFSVVATQTLRVELPLRGGASFFPLTFDDWHFCFAPLVVHAALLEYRRATPRNSAQLRAIRRNSSAQVS